MIAIATDDRLALGTCPHRHDCRWRATTPIGALRPGGADLPREGDFLTDGPDAAWYDAWLMRQMEAAGGPEQEPT